MTFYTGNHLSDETVHLGPPARSLLAGIPIADDVAEPVRFWLEEAEKTDSILYFAIYWQETWAGQILLHDMNPDTGESLIAYHLFDTDIRGKGIGSKALRLLINYVKNEITLRKLVIITSRDNIASQRTALKNGFGFIGPSREDPENGLVFVKKIYRE